MKDVVWIYEDVETTPTVGMVLKMYAVILTIAGVITLPFFGIMWAVGVSG